MAHKIHIPAENLKARVVLWSAVTGTHQYRLAEELGISRSMLSQLLNGKKPDGKYRQQIIDRTHIA